MNKRLFIGAAIAILLALALIFSLRGAGYMGEGITLYRTTYGGEKTAQGYIYIPYTKGTDEALFAQVAIDINGDGKIEGYDTANGKQEEWLVKNKPADAVGGDANRFTFTILDPDFESKAKKGTAVLTASESAESAWPKKFESEKDRSDFTVAQVLVENRDARLKLDPTGRRATGFPAPSFALTAEAQGTPAAMGPNDYARIEGAPDHDQLWNECAPTAIANSFRWLAKKYGFEHKMPQGSANDLIDEIKGDTAWSDGVAHADLIAGKRAFIERHGLPLEAHQIGQSNDDAIVQKMYDEIKKGQAVEVWIDFFNASGSPAGAHLVTVVGAGMRGGKQVVAFHDPDTTSAEGRSSRDVYEVQGGNYMPEYWPGNQAYIRYAYAQSPIQSVVDGTWVDPAKEATVLKTGEVPTQAGSDVTLNRSQFGFFSVMIDHPGDHKVGETFPVRAGVRFTGQRRTVNYVDAEGNRRAWTHGADRPWQVKGEFAASGNVSPGTITDAPPTTGWNLDRYTIERNFTCTAPGVATVSWKATLNWPRFGGDVPFEVLRIHHGAEFESTSDETRVESPPFRCIGPATGQESRAGLQLFCPGIVPDPEGQGVEVLKAGGKCYPKFQFHTARPDQCDADHWHANSGSAVALDGSTWTDPSGCGLGRTKEVESGLIQLSTTDAARFLGGN